MSTEPRITLYPVYGWGWQLPGETAARVPRPFVMRIERFENREWHGQVEAPGHEFDGAVLSIWRRSRSSDTPAPLR